VLVASLDEARKTGLRNRADLAIRIGRTASAFAGAAGREEAIDSSRDRNVSARRA